MRPGRPRGHKPNNIGRMNKGRSNPCCAASAVVREFFARLDADGRSHESVALLAGPSPVTLSRWRNGHCNPPIPDFENAGQVLGYRLVLEPVSHMTTDTDGRAPDNRAQ